MSVALDERFGSKKPDYKLEMKAFRGPISLKRDFRFTPKSSHPADELACPFSAISGREQCDPGQSILVAPIAGRYDEVGDRDRVAIAGARWDL